MKNIQLPAFGETNFFDETANKNSRVLTVENAEPSLFDKYCKLFCENGFEEKEKRSNTPNMFAAFQKNTDAIFINYFRAISELSVVLESNSKYFDYTDEIHLGSSVSVQITQIALEDFGMSYVIRLSDGRFIIIDGGREFELDADKLFACLKKNSTENIPTVAAWIMSHPHSDHFNCFVPFMDKYSNFVKIEKFIFNFPEADDLIHYPKLAENDSRSEEDISSSAYIPLMLERIKLTGAPIYTPHTGQIYRIGDAVCEILVCMDNTIHLSDNINASSTVIRMELGGQIILWTTDAAFSKAKLPERYGEYLKSDILQVPHHGFQCGESSAEIRGYDFIKPETCLLPAIDYNAYSFFCVHREGTRHLMGLNCVKEIITGDTERTLTLPYKPSPEAKKVHEDKLRLGLESGGARVWIFSELFTGNTDDLVFTILNTTVLKSEVWIELFFEDQSKTVRFIKSEIPGGSIRRICIVGDEVDNDARYFNWDSLKLKGIPNNAPFAVRFMCERPIVVSNKNHTPTYHSSSV